MKFYFADYMDTYLVWRDNENGLIEKLTWKDGWTKWEPIKEEMDKIAEWGIDELDEDDVSYWEDYYNPMLDYFGRIVEKYWKCDHCGYIVHYEREIKCWECGEGEMIYHG